MNSITTTLRPGLLVSLKTSARGNVSYFRRALEADKVEEGTRRDKWETERVITDPEEHERAIKVRSKARSLVSAVCSKSAAFGLLCPETAEAKLDAAVAEARKLTDEFNATAKLSRVSFYVLAGRIAPNDIEAVKAINSEVSELLADMQTGVGNRDVETIRDAANRAKGIAQMLSDTARVQAEVAIDAARRAANSIAKAEKGNEEVAVDLRAARIIGEARKLFLDLDETAEVEAPKVAQRALDLAESA